MLCCVRESHYPNVQLYLRALCCREPTLFISLLLFFSHAHREMVRLPSARRQRICRLPLTCHVDFRLCRYMDCIAQQVLALRRPSKSLQREWCPTKLSRLRLQMQLQLQQPVRHRTPSRVTRCRALLQCAVTMGLYFSPVTVFYRYFYVGNTQYTQHGYFLFTCAWSKTRETSSSYYFA